MWFIENYSSDSFSHWWPSEAVLCPAKAVSALTGCREMEDQLCRLQSQNRQQSSLEQECGDLQCSRLSVTMSGQEAAAEPRPVTNPAVISPPSRSLKDIQTLTHTHTGHANPRVCMSEHLSVRCMCACQESIKGHKAVTGDILKEPGYINQNRCIQATPLV